MSACVSSRVLIRTCNGLEVRDTAAQYPNNQLFPPADSQGRSRQTSFGRDTIKEHGLCYPRTSIYGDVNNRYAASKSEQTVWWLASPRRFPLGSLAGECITITRNDKSLVGIIRGLEWLVGQCRNFTRCLRIRSHMRSAKWSASSLPGLVVPVARGVWRPGRVLLCRAGIRSTSSAWPLSVDQTQCTGGADGARGAQQTTRRPPKWLRWAARRPLTIRNK